MATPEPCMQYPRKNFGPISGVKIVQATEAALIDGLTISRSLSVLAGSTNAASVNIRVAGSASAVSLPKGLSIVVDTNYDPTSILVSGTSGDVVSYISEFTLGE